MRNDRMEPQWVKDLWSMWYGWCSVLRVVAVEGRKTLTLLQSHYLPGCMSELHFFNNIMQINILTAKESIFLVSCPHGYRKVFFPAASPLYDCLPASSGVSAWHHFFCGIHEFIQQITERGIVLRVGGSVVNKTENSLSSEKSCSNGEGWKIKR